jgi:hypothetical protein
MPGTPRGCSDCCSVAPAAASHSSAAAAAAVGLLLPQTPCRCRRTSRSRITRCPTPRGPCQRARAPAGLTWRRTRSCAGTARHPGSTWQAKPRWAGGRGARLSQGGGGGGGQGAASPALACEAFRRLRAADACTLHTTNAAVQLLPASSTHPTTAAREVVSHLHPLCNLARVAAAAGLPLPLRAALNPGPARAGHDPRPPG